MKRFATIILTLLFCLCAFAQDPLPPTDTGFPAKFTLGSGIGFKPYQTPINSGSSAFVEGGWQFSPGYFAFSRVELRSTDAQMVVEGCKSVYARATNLLLICGGAGLGADSNSVGLTVPAGGKWFFAPGALAKNNAWVAVEIGVTKSTVPAPVQSNGTTISAVQPDFRIGIHKIFP